MSEENKKPKKRVDVQLMVDEGKGGNGWEHVRVNGVDYAYKYVGGSKGHGNNVAVVGDPETILYVALQQPKKRYVFRGCAFSPEIPDEFWFTRTDDFNAQVHDACNIVASTDYTLLVLDTDKDNLVPCHPMMKNIPPP